MQADWFNAIATVDTEGLDEGHVYRLLRDADLMQENHLSNRTVETDCAATVRVAAAQSWKSFNWKVTVRKCGVIPELVG